MPKEKILVTGSTGLVGSHFVDYSKDYTLLTPNSSEFNLLDQSSLEKFLSKNTPDWIVNFAAYTDVSASELQKEDLSGPAWQLNVQGVQNILNTYKSKNIIQISTDMVFPGTLSEPGPYAETDLPPNTNNHLTWYGWTKNRAERMVLERGGSVLRIIYPVRANFDKKLDFIRGPLKLFAQGKLYPLFNDQQISISYIDEVTTTIQKIISTNSRGVFHASSDTTTPFELIERVLCELGEDPSLLTESSLQQFLASHPNSARYAQWGGLKAHQTEEQLDLHFSTWQTVIEYLLAQGLSI